jgi:hypothetical protein
MNKFRFTIKIFAIATFMFAFATLAQAQATRTWVSGVGDDVNPCSRTAPCKTFAGAISKTAANGEIDCLDPGGFGTVTITKSITIDGTTGAGFGSILASGTNGVNVNDSATATPNTIIVILRNLSIHGAGTGVKGVSFTSGKALHVENCQIFGFRGSSLTTDHAISASLNAATSVKLFVKNCILEENSGDGVNASNANASGIAVVVEETHVSRNNKGITSGTNSKVIVQSSTFVNNTVTGIGADTGSLGLEIDTCLVQGSTNGLAFVAGTSRVAGSRVTNNTNGVTFAGGTMITYGDNKFDGNTNESSGGAIPGPIGKK